jgi:hypothetical protein
VQLRDHQERAGDGEHADPGAGRLPAATGDGEHADHGVDGRPAAPSVGVLPIARRAIDPAAHEAPRSGSAA